MKEDASRAVKFKSATTLALTQQTFIVARNNLARQKRVHPLSFQQVQARLTFFSKDFSSFPSGTCLISVSSPYLA